MWTNTIHYTDFRFGPNPIRVRSSWAILKGSTSFWKPAQWNWTWTNIRKDISSSHLNKYNMITIIRIRIKMNRNIPWWINTPITFKHMTELKTDKRKVWRRHCIVIWRQIEDIKMYLMTSNCCFCVLGSGVCCIAGFYFILYFLFFMFLLIIL